MKRLVRAGCFLAVVVLASCRGESSEPTSDDTEAAATTKAVVLNRDASGLVRTRAPGGGVQLRLDGRFEQAVMAKRNADGSVSTECHDDQHEAEQFLQRPATANKAELQ